jgi:cell division GTPase FtsZ
LVKNLKTLLETIRSPGLINIDFADFKTILKGKEKNIFFNTIIAEGDDRIKKIQEQIIHHPFLVNDLKGVKKVLFNIIGGPDLQMAEIEEISAKIKELNPLAKIIFGLSRKNNFNKKIEVFLMAMTEEKRKVKSEEKKPTKKNQKGKKEKKKIVSKKKEKIPSKEKEVKKIKVIRRSALDIKKMNKDTEFQKTNKEKKWDVPAFLRQK